MGCVAGGACMRCRWHHDGQYWHLKGFSGVWVYAPRPGIYTQQVQQEMEALETVHYGRR